MSDKSLIDRLIEELDIYYDGFIRRINNGEEIPRAQDVFEAHKFGAKIIGCIENLQIQLSELRFEGGVDAGPAEVTISGGCGTCGSDYGVSDE